jgi:hypothetical protein
MGTGGCQVDGDACADGSNCCSRLCVPTIYGGQACQTVSGCRVEGDLCTNDDDCCGGPSTGLPGQGNVTCSKATGQTIGRCRNPISCNPEGNVCGGGATTDGGTNARQDCCGCTSPGPPSRCCGLDLNGVHRCRGAGNPQNCPNGLDGSPGCCTAAGGLCADSVECCNGAPCLPDPSDGNRLHCGTSCVMSGGVCTSTSDCCAGLSCNIPPGSPTGTCTNPTPPPPDAGTIDGSTTDGSVADARVIDAPVVDAPVDAPACALPGQHCSATQGCCAPLQCLNTTGGGCAAGQVCSCVIP